jgi:hypothetical protein
LFSTATGTYWKVDHRLSGEIHVRAIAEDGSRIALGSTSSTPSPIHRQAAMVDVRTLAVSRKRDVSEWLTVPDIQDYVRRTNIRHRFTHICVNQDGLLTLRSRKQQHFAVDHIYIPGADRMVLRHMKHSQDSKRWLTFKNVRIHPHVGFRLSQARWDDGSEAFLDSRGLLHLRSSDTSIPEMSIVLTDSKLAGWCSDGRLWGDRYFIGERESASKRQAFDTIKAFAEQLR